MNALQWLVKLHALTFFAIFQINLTLSDLISVVTLSMILLSIIMCKILSNHISVVCSKFNNSFSFFVISSLFLKSWIWDQLTISMYAKSIIYESIVNVISLTCIFAWCASRWFHSSENWALQQSDTAARKILWTDFSWFLILS